MMTWSIWRLSETELRGILKNYITMKVDIIRKFLNAVAILKSGGKNNQCLELMKASQNDLPHPKSKKHEIYNKIVKCLFEESFPLMELGNCLKYAQSQRDFRWKLQRKFSDYEVFLNYKNSKDGQWINVSKYSLPTEKSFKYNIKIVLGT